MVKSTLDGMAPPPDAATMTDNLDDPVVKARVVRALLVVTPVLMVGIYAFAILQNASQPIAFLLSGLSAAMGLGTAASIHWLGSGSRHVFTAVAALVALIAFLTGR